MNALADRRVWIALARTFGPDVWAHRRTMLTSYAFRMLAIGATLVAPWPLKIIIDHVLSSRPLPPPLRLFLSDTSPQRVVIAMALAIVIVDGRARAGGVPAGDDRGAAAGAAQRARSATACSRTSRRCRRRFRPRTGAASW